MLRHVYMEMDGAASGSADNAPDTGADTAAGQDTGADGSLESIMTGSGKEPNKTETDDKGTVEKGEKAAAGETPAWMKQLTEDMRADSELAKFKSLKELVGAYKGLAAKADGAVKLPAKDAKPEDVQAFFEGLGKPKTVDGYTLKASDGADTKAFRAMAFDANLTDEQATAVYKALEKQGKELFSERNKALAKQFAETDAALRKEYGTKYSEKMTLLKRAMGTFGGKEIQQKLSAAGLSADPDFVRMFIRLGEMSAESGTVAQGANGSGYRSVAEGGMISFEHLDQLK